MKKIFIPFCFILAFLSSKAQLQIGAGISWKSAPGIYVVLDSMSLQHDATSASLDNIFKLTGNTNLSISGTTIPLFSSIEIALTGTSKIILQRSISVSQGINFQSGLLDLNNNNIDLATSGSISGESETARVIGPNGGYIQVINTLNAPSSVNPGNLGAVFTSTQNLGSTTIRRGHMPQTIGNQPSINRYFDISPANNTSLNATLRFTYLDAELNGLDENAILLWKSPDNVNWNEIGSDSRNTTTNFVEKSGIADFSRWTLQLPSGALPVTFISINARCDNGKNIITWKTAQESNSHHFDIERSTAGTSWAVVGSVAASGNSSVVKTYTYTDNYPLPGNDAYRIAEYDINGRKTYTSIVRSACTTKDEIRVWPNPVAETAWLNITTSITTNVIVKLYDSKGALAFSRSTSLTQGNNSIPVNMQLLPAGIYELNVQYGLNPAKTFKLLKQH